jgi:creatinine amidohydrolase
MILAHATWPDIDGLDRDLPVVIPTGSVEQHGRHLPLITDSLIVTAIAEGAEALCSSECLLTPTIWLGASGHHLAFPGSLSNSFDGYEDSLRSIIESLERHGFHKFLVLNGHGGNTEPNGVALRKIKLRNPQLTVVRIGYYDLIVDKVRESMRGSKKELAHACEAETSMVMYLRPELVREGLVRDDGLQPCPPVPGLVAHFDEMTEEGSIGLATLASAATGEALIQEAITQTVRLIRTLREGFVFLG